MADKVITPEFRVSYPQVFEPKKNDMNGKMEYSLVAIFPKDADLMPLKKAMDDAIAERWGADKTKWPKEIRKPFRRCSERWTEKDGKQLIPAGYEDGDAVFITFKATEKYKPGVVDQKLNDIIEPREFYAGCYARASVRAFAYPNRNATGPATANKGVSFGLNNVQKTRDGDPISGGPSRPTDDFTAVEGAAGSETKGAASIFDD